MSKNETLANPREGINAENHPNLEINYCFEYLINLKAYETFTGEMAVKQKQGPSRAMKKRKEIGTPKKNCQAAATSSGSARN